MNTQPAPKRLAGQNALVTGANSGIGEGIARELAAEGANVAVNYVVQPETAEAICDDINKAGGGKAIAIQGDVSKEDDVQAMFAGAIKQFGTLDIVCSNAGIQRDARLVDMTIAQWEQVIGVNLTGAFLCARAAAREFTRRGMRDVSRALGKIIFTSSVHQEIPWGGHCNYATTKGGIMQLMESIAQELAPRKIRVNSICPGAIETAINRKAWDTPQAAAALEKLIPFGRIGVPADVAKVAAWLASDESDYICGASIYVDGGMTLYPGFATGG
ncbi:MAG: glucose 1-dehydrogenase [Xanthomonadales bacterium]|nr:glucose 1-dehydrogenase [Xanthomonadales bacterium]ODU92038.1 MAG: sugar dehydrogenase [Rhodanobacter sp. SCN 66-43]OJY85052.1 MAG: sugar dehydrogenase [Xanthomonadales bacterium 66-474]